ncbi:MAG: putative quinol monooxygenase [Thermodesulfobacteriota bacterium]
MILVRIKMIVLPEKKKELRQTLISLMCTLQKEDGYLSFDIFCDFDDMNVFSLISEWETRQQMNQYLRSHIFTVLLGTRSLLSEPFTISILNISATEGIEYVYSVRNNDEI